MSAAVEMGQMTPNALAKVKAVIQRLRGDDGVAPMPAQLAKYKGQTSINDEVLATGHRPAGQEDPQRVRSALLHLSADCGYEPWRNLCWAVKHALGEAGWPIVEDWSRTAPARYDEAKLCEVWQSDKGDEGGQRITAGTLFRAARAAGWRDSSPPSESRLPTSAALVDDAGLNEVGDARRLAAGMAGRFTFCLGPGLWQRWDGRRWLSATVHEVRRVATDILQSSIEKETQAAIAAGRTDDARRVLGHRAKALQLRHINAAIELLKDIPGFSAQIAQFDCDPWLLQSLDGQVVDLRDGSARPARPEDGLLRALGTPYNLSADCPLWRRTVQECGSDDADWAAFLQRLMGYSLTGLTLEQTFPFLLGVGGNGKSVVTGIWRELAGDYGATIPTEALMVRPANGGATPDLARLVGKRVVFASETEDGQRLSESLVKQITGGDAITARVLYGQPFEFVPQFKVVMSGNHRPVIRGTDNGIWRRLQMVRFDRTFTGQERDPHLLEKLRGELPGILNWAIEGARQWQQQGLNPPASVRSAVAQYRKDMDVVAQWLDDVCEVGDGFELDGGVAYLLFSNWLKDNGHAPMSRRKLTERLQGGDKRIELRKSHGKTIYIGIRTRATVSGRGA